MAKRRYGDIIYEHVGTIPSSRIVRWSYGCGMDCSLVTMDFVNVCMLPPLSTSFFVDRPPAARLLAGMQGRYASPSVKRRDARRII